MEERKVEIKEKTVTDRGKEMETDEAFINKEEDKEEVILEDDKFDEKNNGSENNAAEAAPSIAQSWLKVQNVSPEDILEQPDIILEQPEVILEQPDESENVNVEKKNLDSIEISVKSLEESMIKASNEIKDIHKLYHNVFENRLNSMEKELEHYREIEKGRIFDGILGEISKLYSDNESAVEKIEDEKLRKRFQFMFMDLLQILEANGVSKLKSNQGDKRNTRHCQVVEQVTTNDKKLHDTVMQSRNTGFFIEGRTLIKEQVVVYVFSAEKINKAEDI
jgi:hypothetical protein